MIDKAPGSEIHSKNTRHFCVAFSCTTIAIFMSPAILRSILKVLTLLFTGRNEVVAKVIFLQVSVCPRGGGGCLPQCMLGCHTPPDGEPPRLEKPPPWPGWRTPPRPGWRTPPARDREPPQDGDPPAGMENPPPWEADTSIRSTSGRYASYWNAYLFCNGDFL